MVQNDNFNLLHRCLHPLVHLSPHVVCLVKYSSSKTNTASCELRGVKSIFSTRGGYYFRVCVCDNSKSNEQIFLGFFFSFCGKGFTKGKSDKICFNIRIIFSVKNKTRNFKGPIFSVFSMTL